jgi:hypothetical protein
VVIQVNTTAGPVVIDLQGLTMDGENSSAIRVFLMAGANNVTIKNGTLQNFGIQDSATADERFIDCTFTSQANPPIGFARKPAT